MSIPLCLSVSVDRCPFRSCDPALRLGFEEEEQKQIEYVQLWRWWWWWCRSTPS
jgi:hypothetical protein